MGDSMRFHTLNIHYSFPEPAWRLIADAYATLPGWLGFGAGGRGDPGIPYWFGTEDDERFIWASVEPGGLQIGARMPDSDWDRWFAKAKAAFSEALEYDVGEPEEGALFPSEWPVDEDTEWW